MIDQTPPKKSKASLGDFLFWIAVIVLGAIALLLGGIILYNHWRQTQAPPVEMVIDPGMRATQGIPGANIPLDETLLPPTLAPTLTGVPSETPEMEIPVIATAPLETEPALDQSQVSSEQEFRDDFSSDILGWSEIVREGSKRGYQAGAYYIEVSQPNVFALSFVPETFIPQEIAFDAQVAAGTAGGTYGVLCQYVDELNFYLVELDPFRSQIALGERVDGVYQALTQPEWQPATSFDASPGAFNHVQILCNQGRIEVSLNNSLVAAADVPQPLEAAMQTTLFAAGYTGLDPQGFKVVFDNYSAVR